MNGVQEKKVDKKKTPKTRQSLLTRNNLSWQVLNAELQNLFLSEFNSIFREVKNKSSNWFRSFFYIGCNEILRNISDICGVVIHQKLFNLGIGGHILVLCGVSKVPCVILSSYEEIAKWYPNSNATFCFGLRKKVDTTRLGRLKATETVQNCDAIRTKFERVITANKSVFKIPYLVPGDDFKNQIHEIKLLPPLVVSKTVEPKIDYPKSMKRKERRKLRKERRKQTNYCVQDSC